MINNMHHLFSFYPNPSTGLISLSTGNSLISENTKVEIFNIHGNQVYAAKGDDQINLASINLTEQPKGMYIIRLYDDKGIRSKKLILQ